MKILPARSEIRRILFGDGRIFFADRTWKPEFLRSLDSRSQSIHSSLTAEKERGVVRGFFS